MRSNRGAGRAGCDPIVEVPVSFLSVLKAGFFSSAQAGLETALLAGRPHRGMECRQRLWMSMFFHRLKRAHRAHRPRRPGLLQEPRAPRPLLRREPG